jgi:hypothetical protein
MNHKNVSTYYYNITDPKTHARQREYALRYNEPSRSIMRGFQCETTPLLPTETHYVSNGKRMHKVSTRRCFNTHLNDRLQLVPKKNEYYLPRYYLNPAFRSVEGRTLRKLKPNY